MDGALLEYSLKVRSNGSDNAEGDYEFVDGCIEYTDEIILRGHTLKSRIFGKLGPVDFHYAFLREGIEATVDIEILGASPGWGLKAVTAFTSGFADAIVLYDGSIPSLAQSTSHISSVVAVRLGYELQLKFDITSEDTVGKTGHVRRFLPQKALTRSHSPDILMDRELEPKTYPRYLSFTSKKCSCDSDEVSIDDKFKAKVAVTWSTMGPV
jgi:hypothetical protein